jgi:hypothetical protein
VFANTTSCAQPIVDRLVELVREQVPTLVESGHNWKIVVNGSAGGDVSAAIELHPKLVSKGQVIAHSEIFFAGADGPGA